MKQEKIIIYGMIFLTSIFTGCQKDLLENPPVDNSLTELPVNGGKKMISIEQNGVGIVFCLLNEKGKPATTFKEGENFKFHLAIENNVKPDKSMYIVSDFLRNPDLFLVYNSEGDSIGKPVIWDGMDKISDGYPIKKGDVWTLEFPWHEERGTEQPFDIDNAIRVLQHYFIGTSQPALPKGQYSTKITQQFCLGRYLPHPQHEEICTDTLSLKINFEIK